MLKKALVVDSEYFFVEYLSELLEKRGYQVLKAYDGKEAISRLQQGPVTILFADLILPKIDGRMLFHFARQRFNGSGFPLVALSGIVIEHLEDLDQIGADCYIAKGPLDKLSTQIDAFLDEIENRCYFPQGDRRIWETGGVYPRREAVELLKALQFQQAVIESIAMGVIIVDADTRIIHANAAAQKMLSAPPVGVLNRLVIEFFPEKVRKTLLDAFKTSFRDPTAKPRFLHYSRSSSIVRVVVSPLAVGSKTAGWTLTLDDDLPLPEPEWLTP
jgi:CheY-like chemotaxis protein